MSAGGRAGRVREPRRPGCPRLRSAAAAGRGEGEGAASLLSWRLRRLFLPNRKLPEGLGLPRRGRRRRSRPAGGGQRGPAAPCPQPAGAAAPGPARAGGEQGFPARGESATAPRAGPDGRGARRRAHLEPPGLPHGPGLIAAPSSQRGLGPGPVPSAPNVPAPGSPRSPRLAPRRLLRRRPAPPGWCARLGCASPLALARSRPGLLSSRAPGIKAAADTGLRAEGPAAAAPGPLEERTELHWTTLLAVLDHPCHRGPPLLPGPRLNEPEGGDLNTTLLLYTRPLQPGPGRTRERRSSSKGVPVRT
ncbi:collagen alpha-1(III) chain-like [Elephas maximus indicus]|uniref:collagen alpha-1(III) chain-like n=1 Tax=Elephas maximus indicus TaxID=99487 RepID=UPI002115D285|nr:collagen alpha-1(III) chain-like [Elephas maximus indicus]